MCRDATTAFAWLFSDRGPRLIASTCLRFAKGALVFCAFLAAATSLSRGMAQTWTFSALHRLVLGALREVVRRTRPALDSASTCRRAPSSVRRRIDRRVVWALHRSRHRRRVVLESVERRTQDQRASAGPLLHEHARIDRELEQLLRNLPLRLSPSPLDSPLPLRCALWDRPDIE